MSSMPITVENIDRTKLFIDARYQRPLDENRVLRMATNYDEHMFAPLEVSARPDGVFAVFDGQHRKSLVDLLEHTTVPCRVHRGLTLEQEAALFVSLQQSRKNVSAVSRHTASLVAGNEQAKDIDRIVRKNGYTISDGQTTNSIKAATNVYMVYRSYGAGHLDFTLSLIRELWVGQRNANHGNFITGVAKFLHHYGHKIDSTKKNLLKEHSPVWYISESGMAGMSGKGRSDLMLMEVLRKATKIRPQSDRHRPRPTTPEAEA